MNYENLRDLIMILTCAVLYLASVYLLLEALFVPAQMTLATTVHSVQIGVNYHRSSSRPAWVCWSLTRGELCDV